MDPPWCSRTSAKSRASWALLREAMRCMWAGGGVLRLRNSASRLWLEWADRNELLGEGEGDSCSGAPPSLLASLCSEACCSIILWGPQISTFAT